MFTCQSSVFYRSLSVRLGGIARSRRIHEKEIVYIGSLFSLIVILLTSCLIRPIDTKQQTVMSVHANHLARWVISLLSPTVIPNQS